MEERIRNPRCLHLITFIVHIIISRLASRVHPVLPQAKLTLGCTRRAAKQLGHDLLNGAPAGKVMAVVSVRGDDRVLPGQSGL